ncbi:heme transporter HemC [Niveispirillum sp. SYP-B3756]|uniref:heme ABC transporter permease n=1 Tax=Niveispirillum sp. SYP-B3756 TaxID=2662178 RepID=UPI0012921F2C|nr:heme ABC transporter permease [Niveispirillum sp. SYP-B3756]MQP64168.1 heme transporter HemC [Niveispirillum sp. SYP-B3756]
MHRFANPARFLRLATIILPWAALLSVGLFIAGLWLALFNSPGDYQQGDTVRIMYIHVPAAWMSMFTYSSMAVAAACALVWRHPLAEVYARAAAPIGAGFTLLCLVTGSLWGEPMWGTWWVWDARLTSVLILFFLYLGFMALVNAFDDPVRANRAGSILLLVGAVNVPIIKFSVDWWNTLHQPASVFRMGGPTIHPDMLWPLLLMALAFQTYFVAVVILRMRAELADAKIQTLRMARASAQG